MAPLTIAIPTYNRRESVKQLLESIRHQASSHDEIIVSDDGSKDGTADMAEGLPGIKVLRHQTNQGMVPNWNACLRAASRDWICIIHDDDELEPGGLEALRLACELAAEPALVTHRYGGDRFGNAFNCSYSTPNSWNVLNCPTIPSGVAIHRKIVEEVGSFDARFKYSTDLEYFARVAARFPLLIIESPRVVDYRLHGDNYQIKTWHQPDFYDQLETIERAILGHAGIRDERQRQTMFERRMTDNLLHILNISAQCGDSRLVRDVGRRLWRARHYLSTQQNVQSFVASTTGRYLQLKQFNFLGANRRGRT